MGKKNVLNDSWSSSHYYHTNFQRNCERGQRRSRAAAAVTFIRKRKAEKGAGALVNRWTQVHTLCTCQVVDLNQIFDLQSPCVLYCPTKTQQCPPLVCFKGQRSVLYHGHSVQLKPGERFTWKCSFWWCVRFYNSPDLVASNWWRIKNCTFREQIPTEQWCVAFLIGKCTIKWLLLAEINLIRTENFISVVATCTTCVSAENEYYCYVARLMVTLVSPVLTNKTDYIFRLNLWHWVWLILALTLQLLYLNYFQHWNTN